MTDAGCPLGCIGRPTGPIRKHTTAGIEYRLFHCSVCDLMFWLPLQFPEYRYYDNLYCGQYSLMHTIGRNAIGGHQLGFVEFFRGEKGKLLDVGCADGNFLAWARDAGFAVYGIDLDEAAIRHARKIAENVWPMDITEFAQHAGLKKLRFDTITMFEVLEHQTEPRLFLSKVMELLSPNGWIAGTVPNRGRLFKTGRTAKEGHWDFPPHHFLWFDQLSLARMLQALGFVDVRMHLRGNGYWSEEALHCLGKEVKRRIVGDRSSEHIPLERFQEAGLAVKWTDLRIMYSLRAIKNLVKLPPKAVEIAVETLLQKGSSLYFQAKRPEN